MRNQQPLSIVLAIAALATLPPKSDPAITRSDLEACVATLASDAMRGRFTGTPEQRKAADWLAARLKSAGVQPAGDAGTFLQKVPVAVTRFLSVPKLELIAPDGTTSEGVSGIDFGGVRGLRPTEELELVVVTKEAELPAEPDPALALFLDGPEGDRRRWLGATRGQGFGLVIERGEPVAGTSAATKPPAGGSLRLDDPAAPPRTPSLTVNGPLLEKLRSGAIASVRLDVEMKRDAVDTWNVVGRIDGVGTPDRPLLKDEAVMFSAHYDHLAPDERRATGDTIFNGADDDASGCAAVVELAEAFGAGAKPARTLLFLFATGEEVGLLGSEWFTDHPPVPLDHLKCDLNFEMIGRPDPLVGGSGKLWLTGFERSNLGSEFAKLGVPVVADARPDQQFFMRSDNYSLAQRGVVAQTLSTFCLHGDYHQVSDEAQTLDGEHMERCVRGAYLGARALADGALDPAWNSGMAPRSDRR